MVKASQEKALLFMALVFEWGGEIITYNDMCDTSDGNKQKADAIVTLKDLNGK